MTTDINEGRVLTDHPEYIKLIETGYESAEICYATLLIYLDLIESKKWHQVSIQAVPSLSRHVVTGYSSLTNDMQIILSSSMNMTYTMKQIVGILDVIKQQFNCQRVLLGFVDQDSTIVYYSLTAGLVPPPPPPSMDPSSEAPKQRNRKKFRHSNQNFVLKETNYPEKSST